MLRWKIVKRSAGRRFASCYFVSSVVNALTLFSVAMPRAAEWSLSSDPIYFSHQRETIKRRHGKSEKKTDAPRKNKKRIAKNPFDRGRFSLNRGRIGNSPVRRHWLSRPQRAGFFRSVVANRKDGMHRGSASPRKFIPAPTAQVVGRDAGLLQLLQGFRSYRSRGI